MDLIGLTGVAKVRGEGEQDLTSTMAVARRKSVPLRHLRLLGALLSS